MAKLLVQIKQNLWTNIASTYCGGLSAQPASHTHIHNHPGINCHTSHGAYVLAVVGCEVHQGVRDQWGRCAWCEQEKVIGEFIPTIPYPSKIGYIPGYHRLL